MIIEKGKHFNVSEEEYDDYHIWGLYKAKEDIDTEKLLKEWLRDHPEEKKEYHFNSGKFFSWILYDLKLVEEVDHMEWHMGSYGTAYMRDLVIPHERKGEYYE